MTRRATAQTLTGRSEADDPGTKGAKAMQTAMVLEERPAFDQFDAMAKPLEAKYARQEGSALLAPPEGKVLRGAGEAMVRDVAAGNGLSPEQRAIELLLIDTLEQPTTVNLGASQLRVEAAAKLGILQPALDAAQSADANNSLEKMLCHQLAAAHHNAMTLLGRAVGAGEFRLPDEMQMTRYTNAAARMMDVYREGMLALLKFKTGGKQTVVVQHVTVSDGGQAVIAGSVTKQGDGKTTGGDGSK